MDMDHDNADMHEEIQNRRILAQKKERKIKMIRMLTVVAYLVSVSTVAASLSAYYVFMWNPYAAGNSTQTTAGGGGGAEGIAMALRRVADDCVYADAEADRRHSADGKFESDVLINNNNNYKINSHHVNDIEKSAEFQTTTVDSLTLRTQMKIVNYSSSSLFTEADNNT